MSEQQRRRLSSRFCGLERPFEGPFVVWLKGSRCCAVLVSSFVSCHLFVLRPPASLLDTDSRRLLPRPASSRTNTCSSQTSRKEGRKEGRLLTFQKMTEDPKALDRPTDRPTRRLCGIVLSLIAERGRWRCCYVVSPLLTISFCFLQCSRRLLLFPKAVLLSVSAACPPSLARP